MRARGSRLLLQAAAGLVLWAGTASAHAFLAQATPAVGATVREAPGEVAIEFTESVEPKFSTIEVRDAAGARVDTGPAHLAGGAARLAVAVGALRPGPYTVVWHVVSTDTHRTQGHYGFTVAP